MKKISRSLKLKTILAAVLLLILSCTSLQAPPQDDTPASQNPASVCYIGQGWGNT